MSVDENLNGLRGKIKSPKDSYKRKKSKCGCPILSCDGCGEQEDEQAAKDEKLFISKGFGSVAARAQAWEKSSSSPGYVTIGSVRYGVRFTSAGPKVSMLSRGSVCNERDSEESDICCDMMQMAWTRSRESSLPPSKIPLPNAEKTQSINKRGKASDEKAAPVYRSTLEVSRSKKAALGCFAIDSDESSNKDMKATPPTPNPTRRHLFPLPNFKFGNSSPGEGDTSRLIADSKEDLCGTGNQFQITLDKIQKFRFGNSNDKTSAVPKKKRTSDKTERLRELTDKLLHSRGTGTSSSDGKKPPTSNLSSKSKNLNKQAPGPSLKNLFGNNNTLTNSLVKSKHERCVLSEDFPIIEARVPEVKSDECKSAVNKDKLNSNEVNEEKADPKNLGSCAQRIVAYRSASFSQVDYDTADGKYTRKLRKNGTPLKIDVAPVGCVTFPRVKQVDASTSVSPPPDKVTEKTDSTPSVDSAVGSDEGFAIGSSNNLVSVAESHKPNGARSLTYPLTKKVSKNDEIPFSSIDGNEFKSLHQSSFLNRELSEVKEEISGSSETPTIIDTLSECSNDTVREPFEKNSENCVNNNTDKNPSLKETSKPEKTVYQCTVKEYTVQLLQPCDEGTNQKDNLTLQSLEKEINELLTQQKGNSSPKPEIYVTTWSKEAEVNQNCDNQKNEVDRTKKKLKLKCENDYKTRNWSKEKDNFKETDAKKIMDHKWSGESSDGKDCEPSNLENGSFKNIWIKSQEKPKLTCQSSDEKDEEIVSTNSRYPLLNRNDSLSEGDSDYGDKRPPTPFRDKERTSSPSPYTPAYDLSDNEGKNGQFIHGPRRYSKRPLRGPYGLMLEAEMKKPETTRLLSKKQLTDDLKFLEEYSNKSFEGKTNSSEANRPSSESRLTSPRPKFNTNRSFDDSQLQSMYASSNDSRSPTKRKASSSFPFPGNNVSKDGLIVSHQRTTSSPSQLENCSSSDNKRNPQPSQELLQSLLKGSSERRFVTEDNPLSNAQISKDTRTHVVVELFDTERSYVESLQIIVKKYLRPLKSSENVGLIDASVVDEIFYQVPAILSHHEILLEDLRKRLENWDIWQKVGDIFMEVFTKPTVIETYTSFINNWKTAKEAIRTTCQQKPAFARFLEAMTREHKSKLALDSLIIMPVQRIPRYELLIQRLLKHTDSSHPDHALLLAAQQKVHDLAVKINLTERETLEMEQQQQTLKDLEALIEGLVDLTSSERIFVRHDVVTMASGQGTRKERALFLFSDLLIITSIKRRSGTIRKPSTTCTGSITGSLDANKYKLLMRIPIDDLEIVKTKDENVKKMIREMEKLTEDASLLSQINDLIMSLHCPRSSLEEIVKEMLSNVNKQLTERQNTDSQLSYLELMLNTQHGSENISMIFTKPEKRSKWEESFNECKQKLALSADKKQTPEFIAPVPIRKTRAGLQFTCAAPTLGTNAFNLNDVWVCNSDGYVGQVCVLSLQPEPTVTSCNGVCNARILCIASIPAGITRKLKPSCSKVEPEVNISVEDVNNVGGKIELVSSASSEEEEDTENKECLNRRTSEVELLSNESTIDETENQQPTMWLGTEDGNIHVYLCSDNIRIKKNKVKIQHGSSVQSIIYLDNKVFVSLANGDITVYLRDSVGGWNTSDPYTLHIGTTAMPVTKMIPVNGKLWCACHNNIRILNTTSLQVEHSFQVNSDSLRIITGMTVSGLGVWISLQNSAVIKLYHSLTYDNLCDVNVAPAVTKMLAGCDDIIRQHKAACLRVTALLACKDFLWIGTSAGVVLTMTLPHLTPSTSNLPTIPNVTGVSHGHTGHVRFLTYVEATTPNYEESIVVKSKLSNRHSLKMKADFQTTSLNSSKLLVISGGDGYEDFRNSNNSEVAGREDSTNHLLLWHI